MMQTNTQVQLEVTPFQFGSTVCQILVITLLKPGDLFLPLNPDSEKRLFDRIQPAALATLTLPKLDREQGVILFGSAPTWLYAYLIQHCQHPWVGFYNLPLGEAVVVASRAAAPQVGEVIPMPPRPQPGIAIALGGPPDSGKSVLSNGLRCHLSRLRPDLRVFLHRANWDGEGNWSYEISDRVTVQNLIQQGEYRFYERPESDRLLTAYFDYHAQAVINIRNQVDVVIVDLGGRVQPQKLPVVQQCTHSVIISSDPEKVAEWQVFFESGLQPLAVVHSKGAVDRAFPMSDRFWQGAIDLTEVIRTERVPERLLQTIQQVLPTSNDLN
jgi:CRISPR-associated protein Csx3